jgi:hypothetical protein
MLGTPPQLPAVRDGLTDTDVDRIFGADAALAREIWKYGFDDTPNEERREMPILSRIPLVTLVHGDLDAGWIGDGPWTVAYVPDRDAWFATRDETLGRLADLAVAARGDGA